MTNNIKLNKDSIIYTNLDENGLLLDGKTWKINRDGTTILTLSNYIPNEGNTISGDLVITRDSLIIKATDDEVKLWNDNPNGESPSLSVNTRGVSISNNVDTGMNVGSDDETQISLYTYNNSIEIGYGDNSDEINFNSNGGKIYYRNGTYNTDEDMEIVVKGDLSAITGDYIPNVGNTLAGDLNIGRNGTIVLIGGTNSMHRKHIDLNWGGGLVLGDSNLYDALFINKSWCTLKTDYFKFQGSDAYFYNSGAVLIQPQGTVTISPSVGDVIINPSGNITLNAHKNKKAYYVKNNATPTADDEIATKGDISSVSGGISNIGNTDDTINFTLVRKDFDIYNSYTAGILSDESDIKVFANQGDVHITTDLDTNKAYYYNYEDTPTADREIAVKGDLDNYVLKTDFDQLLIAYNDLADRLNKFLEETGNIEPDAENIIKTANINNISFTITNQNADNDYIIDWGDGTTELSDKGTLAHTYDTANNYMIKINSNNENATGTLSQAKDKIIEIDINTIGIPNIDDDDIITKIIVDNNVMYQGSWGESFIQNADAISEIHIKENCVINTYYPLCQNCPNLVKVIMDAEIKLHINYLFEGCPNLTEVHLTNTTMPVFGESYSLFDTIPDNLKIYVPNNLVNDYKTALPDYATYIIGE